MNSQGEGKSFKEDTLREQLHLAMNQLPTMQAASFVVALVLGYTVRATVPRANICVWILMVLAVVAYIPQFGLRVLGNFVDRWLIRPDPVRRDP